MFRIPISYNRLKTEIKRAQNTTPGEQFHETVPEDYTEMCPKFVMWKDMGIDDIYEAELFPKLN